jgi:magnesium-transporting ATPase (P-type)
VATFPFLSIPPDEVSGKLNSSTNGLSQTAAQEILESVGPNCIRSKEQVTPIGLFLNQFKSPIALILIFATVISAFSQVLGRCHHQPAGCARQSAVEFFSGIQPQHVFLAG